MKIDNAISYCLNKLSNISLTGYDVTNLNYLITKLFDYVINKSINTIEEIYIHEYGNNEGWYIELLTETKSLDFDDKGRYDKYLRYVKPFEHYREFDYGLYQLEEVDDLLRWVFKDETA